MFRRRDQLPPFARLREVLWPRRGWRRASAYLAHRVRRLPGTPYRIAAGFASGAAISFTPFIGFHFVGAAVLAFALRANFMASALGTVVGNPWTFPFIWAWTYALGSWMLGAGELDASAVSFTLTEIFDSPSTVLWPMLLGALPTAPVAWFAVYIPASITVAQYQRARRWRIRRKVAKEGL